MDKIGQFEKQRPSVSSAQRPPLSTERLTSCSDSFVDINPRGGMNTDDIFPRPRAILGVWVYGRSRVDLRRIFNSYQTGLRWQYKHIINKQT
jgi:hypothetical protein